MKRFTLLAAAALVIGLAVGLSMNSRVSAPTSPVPLTITTKKPAVLPGPVITATETADHHVGDSIQYNQSDVHLNSVYTTDGKYFTVDMTITNNSDSTWTVPYIKDGMAIFIDKGDWRTPVAISFDDIPPHSVRSGHVQFTWQDTEVIDTVRLYDVQWLL